MTLPFQTTHLRHAFKVAIGAVSLAMALSTAGCASPPTRTVPDSSNSNLVASESRYFNPGDYAFSEHRTEWHDTARDRTIAAKFYKPERGDPAPVIVFSHGLGGSTDAATYLGEHLASWGFLSVHIQHPGSDTEVWQGERGRFAIVRALRQAAANPQTAIDRFNDLPFALDQISDRRGPLELNADTSRMGMAGHSFGAHSVLAAAGRAYVTQDGEFSFKDDRIKAAVALSPAPPGRHATEQEYPQIYAPIDIPIMHMTGTEDTTPLDRNQSPTSREIPFRFIQGSPQYLVVFEGGDHGVFSGQRLGRPAPENYPRIQAHVSGVTIAFFLAHLNDDAEARDWLNGPGLMNALSDGDRIERK